ncbi:MAG: RagB/SusD family nutrient uptake outer membrane protein [Dysgonamonadaceae bacterium]|jgi:tetratricopeptide (TPR) repeat protein|nr:RagB/SusD family nutrient uptake outer membrane protein [Dysgonamonadaceae bacterium]
MKKIFGILCLFVLSLSLAGCSDEYFDAVPTASTATPLVFETTENAAMAINGICKTMSRQYLSSQGMNGEGTIKMYYGNYPGNHFMVNLPGWAPLIIPDAYHTSATSTYTYYPWYYYYRLVGDGNTIIFSIDNAAGPEAEKQFIKAQALTFRAYAFMMMAQLYGYRWSDSNNGSTSGLVLRLEPTTDPMPLSTLAETYERIYKDLDEAIDLYTQSKIKRDPEQNWLPDINVAYATYARAAINKQDYGKAAEMAVKAREGYPLMTVDEYKAGFFDVNREWIWSSVGKEDETLYYYSYHAYIAYNSNAGAVRTTPKCMSKDLYETISLTDIRKELFLDPMAIGANGEKSYSKTTGQAVSSGTDKAYGDALIAYARSKYPGLEQPPVTSVASIFAYMQFKIANRTDPGVGDLNHFRSSEMYLIEAEAQYKLNQQEKAQQLLVQLIRDSGRDPNYNCNLTGDALFTEIKRIAQIELWGEGLDWFMMKRWGDTVIHKHFNEGGNFPTSCDGTVPPDRGNKWTWVIPNREKDYNPLIVQ